MAVVATPDYLKSAAREDAAGPDAAQQHQSAAADARFTARVGVEERAARVAGAGRRAARFHERLSDDGRGAGRVRACIRPQGSCGRACPGRALMLGAGRLVSYVRRTSRLLPESTQIVAGRRACRGGVEERLFASHAVSGKATATRQIVAVESPRVMATEILRTDVAPKKRRLKQAASNGEHVLRCARTTARKVIQRRHGCRRRYDTGSARRDSVNRPKRVAGARSRPDRCVDRA